LVLEAEIERIIQATGSRGKRLLDFGCGTGGLLTEAERSGFEVCGIEPNEDAIGFVRRVKNFRVYASLEELRDMGEEDAFDVVVARHTLEHVADPKDVLGKLRGLLKPGGLLVIIVPHFNFFTGRVLPNSMPRLSYGLIHKGHQYYFTRETLSRYLREAGFSTIHFPCSILGGFLSRWFRDVETSGNTEKRRMLSGASMAFSYFLHVTRLRPVLTVYAR